MVIQQQEECLERLRLECEFFLIAGKKEKALHVYDKILELNPNPFLLTAKAKLLESLYQEFEASQNFQKALQLTENSPDDREEIIRLILELEKNKKGILRVLVRNSLQKKEDFPLDEEEKEEDLKESEIDKPDVGIGRVPAGKDSGEKAAMDNQETRQINSEKTVLDNQKTRLTNNEKAAMDNQETRQINSEKTVLDSQETRQTNSEKTVMDSQETRQANSEKTMLDSEKNQNVQVIENNEKTLLCKANTTKENRQCLEIMPENMEKTVLDIRTPQNENLEKTILDNKDKTRAECSEVIKARSENTSSPSNNAYCSKSHCSGTDLPASFCQMSQLSERTDVMERRPAAIAPTIEQKRPSSLETKMFGRYKIIKKLGEGGMGVVYTAYDIELDRTVAMKVISGIGSENALQAQRFLQEVKATARLHHPNIVAIYDFGETPQHYFTMEYVEGKTLSQKIREEIFQSRRAAQILKYISCAIECAHKAKIIHRDLKPSNIMIDESGNVKVMDFGLAKFMESETAISRTGDILGTPSYMSPEQALGKTVDERSDIYSIGAIGYEMITGQAVFKGENVFTILHQVSNKEPSHPRSLNINIDRELETIILKCLEKLPAKRYQNAKELTDDIERYLENRPIMAKPPTPLSKAFKWVKRNKELSFAILVVLLTISGIFTFISYQWLQQSRRMKAFDLIAGMMKWNKEMISYHDDVKPRFYEAIGFAPDEFIIYRNWGYYCMQYAHFQGKNKDLSQEEYQEAQCQRDTFYREAEEKFLKALELKDDDPVSLYYLVLINASAGNTKKYREYSDKLIHLDKDFKNILDSSKALQAGDYEKAAEGFERALRYNSELFCAYSSLGEIYIKQGNYAKAQEHLETALQLAPLFYPALVGQGKLYTIYGHKCLKNNEMEQAQLYLKKAKASLEKAIVLAPVQNDIYYKPGEIAYLAGKACYWMKDMKSSQDHFQNARNLGFNNFEKELENPGK